MFIAGIALMTCHRYESYVFLHRSCNTFRIRVWPLLIPIAIGTSPMGREAEHPPLSWERRTGGGEVEKGNGEVKFKLLTI